MRGRAAGVAWGGGRGFETRDRLSGHCPMGFQVARDRHRWPRAKDLLKGILIHVFIANARSICV